MGEFDARDGGDESQNVGRTIAEGRTDIGAAMAHLYRGEMDRVTTWRQRLDQTTYWAVTLMAAILTWAFSSEQNPHYVLLGGVATITVFLWIEARRYRGYDLWRTRTRVLQKNLFALILDPSRTVDSENWRAELGKDFQDPSPKLSALRALSHRLRRVYLPLLLVLLAAWIVRISAFEPGEPWTQTASIASVPGSLVVATVAGFYLIVLAVALYPGIHHVKGEFYGAESEE